jgi:hypothetical protein
MEGGKKGQLNLANIHILSLSLYIFKFIEKGQMMGEFS